MLRNCCYLLALAMFAFAPLAANAGDGAKDKKKDEAKVEAKDQAAKKEGKKEAAKADQKKAEAKKAQAKKADPAKKAARAEKKANAEKKPDAAKKAKREQAAKEKRVKAAAGVVKSVDSSAKTITITKTNKKKQTSEDVTLPISEEATVVIQGEVKTLADVAAGKRARLMLSEDGKKVISIQMGGKKKEKKPAA